MVSYVIFQSLQELLGDIGGSPTPHKLAQFGNTLAEAIQAQQQQRKHISTEEMKAVLQERDTAVNKVREIGLYSKRGIQLWIR